MAVVHTCTESEAKLHIRLYVATDWKHARCAVVAADSSATLTCCIPKVGKLMMGLLLAKAASSGILNVRAYNTTARLLGAWYITDWKWL